MGVLERVKCFFGKRKGPPDLYDLSPFLDGEFCRVPPTHNFTQLPANRHAAFTLKSRSGELAYTRIALYSGCTLEKVDVIPKRSLGDSFSLTLIADELSVMSWRDGEPDFECALGASEKEYLQGFMMILRKKVEGCAQGVA